LYEADDTRPPRVVAIKLLSPSLASYPGYLELFEREAFTAAQLSHPHICKILDYGRAPLRFSSNETKELNYICMDMLDGGSLADHLDNVEDASAIRVAAWVDVVSEALTEAHQIGVVHAGLKPTSIVFSRSGAPFVTDFAIAIRPSDQGRLPFLGDPDYLAPEQWQGCSATASTDQYSLAALAFRNLTGGLPYEGQQDPDRRARNFAIGPPSADTLAKGHGRAEVAAPVSRVFAKALAVRPEDRYPSILEFALAFRQAIGAGQAKASGDRSVFISYRRDPSSGWAVLIAKTLKERYAIDSFVDTQRMDGAVQIPLKIQRAIQQCDLFVCLLARQTLKSAWVLEEIRLAAAADKPMIPVFHEGFKPPRGGSIPEHVDRLINHEGVRVYADYDDAAIAKLASIIRSNG